MWPGSCTEDSGVLATSGTCFRLGFLIVLTVAGRIGPSYSSHRPILDRQSRHGAQIAVLGDDGAVAQGEHDRGQLHINDRHDAANALEFLADPPKMLSRLVFERPFREFGQRPGSAGRD